MIIRSFSFMLLEKCRQQQLNTRDSFILSLLSTIFHTFPTLFPRRCMPTLILSTLRKVACMVMGIFLRWTYLSYHYLAISTLVIGIYNDPSKYQNNNNNLYHILLCCHLMHLIELSWVYIFPLNVPTLVRHNCKLNRRVQ